MRGGIPQYGMDNLGRFIAKTRSLLPSRGGHASHDISHSPSFSSSSQPLVLVLGGAGGGSGCPFDVRPTSICTIFVPEVLRLLLPTAAGSTCSALSEESPSNTLSLLLDRINESRCIRPSAFVTLRVEFERLEGMRGSVGTTGRRFAAVSAFRFFRLRQHATHRSKKMRVTTPAPPAMITPRGIPPISPVASGEGVTGL